jgi:NAD(P)-dependent dehydrogenase (short-subunit alcohol dehydrogenase family)
MTAQPSPATPHRPTALITGAARRIGRAIALALADRGYHIAVHYGTSRADADELVDQLAVRGSRAFAVQADLSRADDVAGLMVRVADALGPPTVLVNCASQFRDDTVTTMTAQTWELHLDTNLRAPVFLAQALAAHLPDGALGHVINIIDQRVLAPSPEFFTYSLSKAGLWAATRTLAQALAPRIRVNAIGPGPVLQSVHQSEADFAAECAATLLKRPVSPDEIAAAVCFLLDAPSVTGQLIALDSGQHLS